MNHDNLASGSPSGALPTGLYRLEGSNFSGRSDWIKTVAAETSRSGGTSITIPPEINTALSGLMPNVADELEIHSGSQKANARISTLFSEWGLRDLSHRDPMTLSGGEQAMLVILCKLATYPKLLALDGALEQLDPKNTIRVLNALHEGGQRPRESHTLISHNGSWPGGCDLPRSYPGKSFKVLDTAPPPISANGFDPGLIDKPALIEVRDLKFYYSRSSPVLHNFSAAFEPGRIIRLKGSNGAGKTTLTRILCGVLKLCSGSISINGHDCDPYIRPGSFMRIHFQNPDVQLFESTVEKEICSLPIHSRGSALQFAGLQDHLLTHPFDLPFVLRKRLSLACTLFSDAPWLVFDEPTLGLDSHSRGVLVECLERLVRHGRGVMLISHNEDFVESISSIETINLLQHQPNK